MGHGQGKNGPESTLKKDDGLLKEYALGEVLGQGAFGVVYACCKKGDREYKYAVKMVEKCETPLEEIKKEAAVLSELKHPNVVVFQAVFYEKCLVCIVMERYNGGDLISGMQSHWKTKGKIPPTKVIHINRQMARAIYHCHSKGFVHCDVKGDNFLIDRKDVVHPDCRVLLSDFGTCTRLKNPDDRLKAKCGTKFYWPPEFYDRNYGAKVDVWAVGVIMYGLILGRFPFKTEQDVRTKQIKFDDTVPALLREVVKKCLEKEEAKRINSKDLLESPWLADGDLKDFLSTEEPPKDVKANKEETRKEDRATTAEFHDNQEDFREIGAEDHQKDRRLELVERLEMKGGKTLQVMSSAKMCSEDKVNITNARTKETRTYEWWPEETVKEKFPEYFSTAKNFNEESEQGVDATIKMLEEHDICTSSWGKGQAKSVEEFAKELQTGAANLMLDASEHKKLVRVVNIVLLRLQSDDDKYLTEDSEKMKDGRTRTGLNRLPGTKKEPHENTRATATRIVSDVLGLKMDDVSFSFEKAYCEEEVESLSFPGVRTVYRKEIVNATYLQESVDFVHKDSLNNAKNFAWLTKSECDEKSVMLEANISTDEHTTGLIQAPVGLTVDDLEKFLMENKVDTSKFGVSGARTLKEFSAELRKGESTLMKGADGNLTRIVDIVLLLIYKPDKKEIFVERQVAHPDGTVEMVQRLPGTKRRPDENQFYTASRILKRELQIDTDSVTLDKHSVKCSEETKPSDNFPGIVTLYRKRFMTARLS